ncbi:hypothetical protein, partial [Kingella kingae]|uniref:hypothetical protein n=1 Tax=Kingella kingae TaxID=504 RepID=UPI001AD83176
VNFAGLTKFAIFRKSGFFPKWRERLAMQKCLILFETSGLANKSTPYHIARFHHFGNGHHVIETKFNHFSVAVFTQS